VNRIGTGRPLSQASSGDSYALLPSPNSGQFLRVRVREAQACRHVMAAKSARTRIILPVVLIECRLAAERFFDIVGIQAPLVTDGILLP
jgi:hypothetical protein